MFQLEDYLGSIAGVFDLLMYFVFFVFGSYIDFLSRVKWIKANYRFERHAYMNTEADKLKHSILKMLNMGD